MKDLKVIETLDEIMTNLRSAVLVNAQIRKGVPSTGLLTQLNVQLELSARASADLLESVKNERDKKTQSIIDGESKDISKN